MRLSQRRRLSATMATQERNKNQPDFALFQEDVSKRCKMRLRWNDIHRINVGLLIVLCLCGFTSAGAGAEMPDLGKIPTPPSFVHEPNPDTMYFLVEQAGPGNGNGNGNATESNGVNLKERRFRCQASGMPQPMYTWYKNDAIFPLDHSSISSRLTRIPGEGSFIFSRFTEDDKGIYRCKASNGNGTALDKEINFVKTSLNSLQSRLEIKDVEFGKPFQTDCHPPPSVPPARAYWILMSSAQSNERRLFQTINSTNIAYNDKGTIFFQYVREQDNITGFFYTCMAENVELKDYKFGYQFTFNVTRKPNTQNSLEPYILPVKQYYSPTKMTVLQGQSFELFCIVAGYPDFIPKWSKLSGEIDLTRVTYSTNFKKSIKIDDVRMEDEGTYKCEFNDNRLDETFKVTVEAAPYWVGNRMPANVNSSELSTVEFICNAQGRPTPSYTFYKNGNPISSNDKYVISGPRLEIKNIRKEEDGKGDNAVYQCKADNEHGNVWANFYLNILAFPPIILEQPGSVSTVAGRSATLTCKVFGSPMPKVTWSSNQLMGAKQNKDYTFTDVQADGTTSLTINNIKKNQAGEYSCSFQNIYDKAAAVGTVQVRNATVITTKPEEKEVMVGKPLEVECAAMADPELTVRYTWLFNGQVVSPNQRVKVDPATNRLIVENPSSFDTGKYSCVAETDLDKVTADATISVKDIPPSPTDLHVVCSDKSASIAFSFPPTVEIVRPNDFIIQYNIDPDEPDAWDTHVAPILFSTLSNGRGSAEISLFPFGKFAFRIIARNNIGYSIPAYPVNVDYGVDNRCVTLPAVPARNPAGVEIKQNAESGLVVSWEPVPRRDWYGPKFAYEIQYKPEGADDSEFKNKTIDDPYRSSDAIDEGIKPYEPYDVLVWSKNNEGLAEKKPTTKTGRSGESVPTVTPTGFMIDENEGPSSARFKWDAVDPTQISGEFKGYKIVHWSANAKRSEPTYKEALFDSKATFGTIYDLKPNKQNYAKISVCNNAGEGPASDPIEFMMPEGVPTSVQDVSVFPISDKEIGVFFKPPRETNGNLTGYELKVCPIKNEKVDEEHCKPKNISADDLTETRLKDLNASSPYRVELRGRTNAGLGDPVSAETNTTKVFEPTVKPLEPTVENVLVGHDHVNVTWKPGQVKNGTATQPPGDKYHFKYRPVGDADWVYVKDVNDTGFSKTVKNLLPSTKYELKAVSIHGTNESESATYTFETAGEPTTSATIAWLIAIIIAIIILVIILIIVCLVVRSRGAKYPVSEKEKEQGREPMLKDEKGFGEYSKPDVDEEKRSLTAESNKPESETDSMAEYGDGETGRFTEDGSFIGQYGAANKTTAPERGKPNLSTFV